MYQRCITVHFQRKPNFLAIRFSSSIHSFFIVFFHYICRCNCVLDETTLSSFLIRVFSSQPQKILERDSDERRPPGPPPAAAAASMQQYISMHLVHSSINFSWHVTSWLMITTASLSWPCPPIIQEKLHRRYTVRLHLAWSGRLPRPDQTAACNCGLPSYYRRYRHLGHNYLLASQLRCVDIIDATKRTDGETDRRMRLGCPHPPPHPQRTVRR